MSKIKLSPNLFNECAYFLPRLMFLHSRYGPNTHWGDIVSALHRFPETHLNLASELFWIEWQKKWQKLADDYVLMAKRCQTKISRNQFLMSAVACYHWSEFMYFSDNKLKSQLRNNIKYYFLEAIHSAPYFFTNGEILCDGNKLPYYLILPDKHCVDSKNPCVVLVNGLDSVTEVEVYNLAEKFLERGIATLLFETPGQGGSLGIAPLDTQIEKFIPKIIRFLDSKKYIDADKLCFFGVSFGGYLALRVAKYLSKNFKAIVNLSGGPKLNSFIGLPRRLKSDFQYAFMLDSEKEMEIVFDQLSLDIDSLGGAKLLSIHGSEDDIFPIKPIIDLHAKLGHEHTLIIYQNESHVCLNKVSQYMAHAADWVVDKFR